MRKRLLTALLGLLGINTVSAQVTLRLTAVPVATPADATIYVAGSFNDWNPASAAHALTRRPDGTYEITLPAGTGTIEYKFTRGSWATVETTVGYADAPNRRYTFAAGVGPANLSQQVLSWQDQRAAPAAPKASTAAANVQLLAPALAMPQLAGRTRRVWLYLPPDYATTTRRYPVLYLQDGQNVFDAATAFAGEWGVDETLNQLAAGNPAMGCIVVSVDNGGAARLDEYSPWRNAKYGGGEGDAYLEFLVRTLKPYVDAHYRTAPGPAGTGIGGSSMGALIATYAALKYPAVFGSALAFSPAYWFAEKPLFDYVRQHPASPTTRFYFVSGTTEGETMVPLMRALRDALHAGGVPATNLSFNTRPDGQHAEWFWQREFAAAYKWLYGPATVPAAAHQRGAGARPGRHPYPPQRAEPAARPAKRK